MKNYIPIHVFLILLIPASILWGQNTYVPDDNFEQALIDLGYDDVIDDFVLTENISGVTSLDVNGEGISDLTGIEDFTALVSLYCNPII